MTTVCQSKDTQCTKKGAASSSCCGGVGLVATEEEAEATTGA